MFRNTDAETLTPSGRISEHVRNIKGLVLSISSVVVFRFSNCR
jgi:hypothetical protein